MIRDEIEEALRQRASGAQPIGATIKFDLGSDGSVFLDGKANPPTVSDSSADADTTIVVSASDLKDMIEGSLNPMEAFTLGRLEVNGDMGPAMQLGSMLG